MSMFFDTYTVPVSSLHELAAALSELEQDTASMVIRGALIEGRETQSIRRTGKASLWNDPGSNFNAMPRQWCMIDIDDMDLSEGQFMTCMVGHHTPPLSLRRAG